jgi:hypothetical protein
MPTPPAARNTSIGYLIGMRQDLLRTQRKLDVRDGSVPCDYHRPRCAFRADSDRLIRALKHVLADIETVRREDEARRETRSLAPSPTPDGTSESRKGSLTPTPRPLRMGIWAFIKAFHRCPAESKRGCRCFLPLPLRRGSGEASARKGDRRTAQTQAERKRVWKAKAERELFP